MLFGGEPFGEAPPSGVPDRGEHAEKKGQPQGGRLPHPNRLGGAPP
jgi:hypothetical protein